MIARNRTWPIGQSPDERVRQRTLPVSGSDGATVSFDFVGMGGVLDSRWTFSRAAGSGFLAGTGPTYIGADGLVKYATTNQPRFDYDPTTLLPRGLLIEGSANNLARYSETLETTGGFWGYNAATRTVESSDINPTGGTGSISFGPTTNGGSRYCGLFLTGQTTTVAYTYSVWVKAKGTSSLVVSIQNSAGAVNSNARIISQPSGATASFTGSGGGFPQVNNLSATGWTRIELTTTGNLGGTGVLNVFMYPKDTSGQTTADTVFAWGAQLEAGSGASSHIPTGSAIGTREQDTASFADAAAIGFDRRKGTLYFSGTQFKHASSFARSVRLAAAPGGSEPIGIAVNGSTFYGTARDASFVAFGDAIRTNTLLQPFAFAVAFNADTPSSVLRGSLNGSSVSVTQSSAAAPPTAAAVSIDLNSGSSATAYASMAIRSVKFWPTDKTLSELTSITS